LSWTRKVVVDGEDRLPAMIETLVGDGDPELRARIAGSAGTQHPVELARLLGALPSYYLRYYYDTDRVLEDQRAGHVRAKEVIQIEAGLLELYRDRALDTKPELLERRGGAHYSEAAAMLVASLHDGAADVQVANVRKERARPPALQRANARTPGATPTPPGDDVVEMSPRIPRDGAPPVPTEPLAPELL